jgi:hypothetical protein
MSAQGKCCKLVILQVSGYLLGSYCGGMDLFDAADAQSRTNSKEMLNVSFINVGKNVCTTLHGC